MADKKSSEERRYRLLALVKGDALARPEKKPEDMVMTFPYLVIIEVLAALLVSVILVALSLLRNAPLEELANPEMPPHVAKASWYLVGLQEMLLHMDPVVGGIVLPGLAVFFLMTIPYVDRHTEGTGIWFTSAKGRRITVFTALLTLIVIPLSIYLSELLNLRVLLPLPIFVTNAMIPFVAILAQVAALGFVVKKLFEANTREVIMAIFTALFVAWVLITFIGQVCRGPGMQFYWPWQPWPVE